MPEISTEQYLRQIDHCVEGLRTADKLRDEEIDEIKLEVASLLQLCTQGMEVIARAGIDLIAPRIEALVKYPDSAGRRELTRDTLPAPAPEITM